MLSLVQDDGVVTLLESKPQGLPTSLPYGMFGDVFPVQVVPINGLAFTGQHRE